MASVALEHVGKAFPGGISALCNLNFQVGDGELVVLVGPSGSGKTTILRLIAGLDRPTSGIIRLSGHDAASLPPSKRNVAMVFQRHNLYPHLTVHENLVFGLREPERRDLLLHDTRVFGLRPSDRLNILTRFMLRLMPVDGPLDERVREVAGLLSITDLLQRKPAQLSGGEMQRVALGRALVRQPGIFLLDEPLSQLDAPLRNELRRELHLLHRRICATMIYVTHDQLEAMTLGQRVIVLDRGVVQQADRPETIYDRPRNRFVAGFIGWPPMNFLAGRLVQADTQVAFEACGRKMPLPPRFTDRLATFAGREVTLGIRPEHVGLVPVDLSSVVVPMEVILVEPLGGFQLVTFARDNYRLSGRIEQRQDIKTGQTIEVALDMRYVHLFYGDGGKNLMEPFG